jgi:hypothetical protein
MEMPNASPHVMQQDVPQKNSGEMKNMPAWKALLDEQGPL